MEETPETGDVKEPNPFSLDRFDAAMDAFADLQKACSEEELSASLTHRICMLLGCENASILLREGEGELQRLIQQDPSGQTRSSSMQQGIAGIVARNLIDYITNAPEDDPLFVAPVDGLNGEAPRNLIATPMSASTGEIGVLIARNATNRIFKETDFYWLHRLARHGAAGYSRLRREGEGWGLAQKLMSSFCATIDDCISPIGRGDRIRRLALALGRDLALTQDEMMALELSAWLHHLARVQLTAHLGDAENDLSQPTREKLGAVIIDTMLKRLGLPGRLDPARIVSAISLFGTTGSEAWCPDFKLMSLPARVLRLAERFETLTSVPQAGSSRPLTDDEALTMLEKRAGLDLDPGILRCFREKESYKIERRQFPRFASSSAVDAVVLDKHTLLPVGETVQGQALDLGESGICFCTAQKVPDHALMAVTIHLPSNTLKAYARVVRQAAREGDAGCRVAAYFLGYDTLEK